MSRYRVTTTNTFIKGLKRCAKRGYDMSYCGRQSHCLPSREHCRHNISPINLPVILQEHGSAISAQTGYLYGSRMIQNLYCCLLILAHIPIYSGNLTHNPTLPQ